MTPNSSPLTPLRPRRRSALPMRLVTLAVMLALVAAAMNSLRQPETIARLGRVFGLTGPATPAPAAPSQSGPLRSESSGSDAARLVDPTTAEWDTVQDNAPFGNAEETAWFALLAAVQPLSPLELAEQSLGEVSYAQWRSQPEVYRGRVATVRGTIRRVERKQPAANELGIDRYYRVWMAPAGGGESPVVLYALTLPERFPVGDELREPAIIHAALFKEWLYSYDDGVAIAPVAVTSTWQWSPRVVPGRAKPEQPSRRSMWWLFALAAAVAAAWVALVVRRTRRPCRAPLAEALPGAKGLDSATLGEQLAELAAEDRAP